MRSHLQFARFITGYTGRGTCCIFRVPWWWGISHIHTQTHSQVYHTCESFFCGVRRSNMRALVHRVFVATVLYFCCIASRAHSVLCMDLWVYHTYYICLDTPWWIAKFQRVDEREEILIAKVYDVYKLAHSKCDDEDDDASKYSTLTPILCISQCATVFIHMSHGAFWEKGRG